MRPVFACALLLVAACGSPKGRGPGGDDDDDGGGIDAPTGVDPDGGGTPETTYVYAHTASALYKVDPDSLAHTKVGDFVWSNGSDSMTDIAIDKTGLIIGVSGNAVYRVDASNAHATRLSSGTIGGSFNGLSFVPAANVGQTGDDVLVGTRSADGLVFRVDPATGAATQVGNMGSYTSSGDLVAVANFGMVLTANGSSSDRLVRLAPNSFTATPVGNGIGFSSIFGIAFWKDKVFGFTSAGQFITIDPNTGVGTLVQGNGPAWWGAAVTTSAPVIF